MVGRERDQTIEFISQLVWWQEMSSVVLLGCVELDESLFGPAGKKQSRGSKHKIVVLCAV